MKLVKGKPKRDGSGGGRGKGKRIIKQILCGLFLHHNKSVIWGEGVAQVTYKCLRCGFEWSLKHSDFY